MHPIETRNKARALYAAGQTLADISCQLGLSRRTVHDWCRKSLVTDDPLHSWGGSHCGRCADPPRLPDDRAQYSYLLGLYLGDGHLSLLRSVYRLRIFCTAAYTDLLDECASAMEAVLPNKVGRITKGGCTIVYSYSKHWPCMFPQHGPGMKHQRQIALEPWQKHLVTRHPKSFIRGLIHSDGCRVLNHTTVKGKRYEYIRYQFSNESNYILNLCGWALDLIGAEWRYSRYNCLSVAKKDSVALLETFIGPKS